MTFNWRKAATPAIVLGALTLLIHLLVNSGYGIFRDELYFIVCGRRLAWGYVDQPPLIPLLAAGSYGLFGDFLVGFRLIPALAMAATVALTAEFVRAIGGGRFAQWLAGLCVLAAPHFLAIGLLFTTDTFQTIGWLGCFWCLVRIEQTKDERWWLLFGAIAGVTLLGKYMIAFFLVTLAVGLLLTPLRRSLLKPWVYVGILIAAAMVLPNLLWQASHDWPFLELGAAAKHGKNVALSPVGYLGQQIGTMGLLAAPVWIAGLWGSAYRPKYKTFRALPIAFALMVAIFVAEHGKAYYLASIYPILFAVGAVTIESWTKSVALRAVVFGLVILSGLVSAPLAVPVFSEARTIRFMDRIGESSSKNAGETVRQAKLPQHFADMHGWPAFAAKIATAYNSIPPDKRAKAVFFANNYGEAAAVDVYGEKLGLPPAISGHNNYWIWGPRGADGSVVIVVGGEPKDYEKYGTVRLAGRTDAPYAMPYETGQPIYVLTGRKLSLKGAWPKFKHYD